MPREIVDINVSTLPVYEAGAAFLAWVAHPNSKGDRDRFWASLCKETLRQIAQQDPDRARRHEAIRPEFFAISDATAEAALKVGFRLLRERVVTGHRRFFPFLARAQNSVLRVRGLPVTQDNMAILALADLGSESVEISNVKARIFKPSLPVIHAAAALAMLTQVAAREGERFGLQQGERLALRMLLHHQHILETAVLVSEDFRGQLDLIERPRVLEQDTIQFRLQ